MLVKENLGDVAVGEKTVRDGELRFEFVREFQKKLDVGIRVMVRDSVGKRELRRRC